MQYKEGAGNWELFNAMNKRNDGIRLHPRRKPTLAVHQCCLQQLWLYHSSHSLCNKTGQMRSQVQNQSHRADLYSANNSTNTCPQCNTLYFSGSSKHCIRHVKGHFKQQTGKYLPHNNDAIYMEILPWETYLKIWFYHQRHFRSETKIGGERSTPRYYWAGSLRAF